MLIPGQRPLATAVLRARSSCSTRPLIGSPLHFADCLIGAPVTSVTQHAHLAL